MQPSYRDKMGAMGAEELAIKDGDFEANARLDGTSQLRLSGNADASSVHQLTAFVHDLHAQLLQRHIPELQIDIRSLEFMNATCFNVLVSWVTLINDLPLGERYKLRFSTNPAIPWQRRSLRTLSCFATDLVLVES
jgi:hypothetical protein